MFEEQKKHLIIEKYVGGGGRVVMVAVSSGWCSDEPRDGGAQRL